MRIIPKRSQQSGLSLIELMIGMVLGLIILTALINMFAGSSRSAAFSDGLRTMQENGRHGIQTLKRGIRLAGYSPTTRIDPFDIPASGVSTLVVRTTAANDCTGLPTPAGVAEDTYSWDSVAQQITCTGNGVGSVSMPVVDGVEGFRILYGIDTSGDGFPNTFRQYNAGIDAQRVRAIRLALLASSEEPIRSRNSALTHVLFDNELDTTDRVARHVFTTTVLIRNLR